MELERYEGNPVLSPTDKWWENKTVFNCAAANADGKVHLLYRAQGDDYVSRFGYAATENGFDITERSSEPIYESVGDELERLGVEDPRITLIEGTYYITYTGASTCPCSEMPPSMVNPVPWRCRVGMLSTKDFKTFTKHGCILPDMDNKDVVLFPEKVGGKYVMLHRTFPNIWIAYSDDLMNWYDHKVIMRVQPGAWDCNRIGAGAPPIKTEYGWMNIYHGVDHKRVYRLGILMLELEDPSKVIGRSPKPILSPEKEYEKVGIVPDVVFSCGAVEKDGRYFVYYGGADKVIGVATMAVEDLKKVKLEKPL
ncbi:MAG TPA: glycosidase [Armatimonadetes bacterium]|nr:glycosidase [Armatimonadota bacterium]